MKDLTQNSIARNIIAMAVPIGAGMVAQTFYLLVDLYFVAGSGGVAIAGVSAAGTLLFVVLALTQVLAVGTVASISQAVGRKDRSAANLVFNQSLLLTTVCAAATLVVGYAASDPYLAAVAADPATRAAGVTFLRWFLPGLALQFALVTLGSALRGTGNVKPTLVVQSATVLLNAALAPVLIAGWGTGKPLGLAGAGLASTLSVAAGVVMLAVYLAKLETYLSFRRELWRPQLAIWKRLLRIGVPAGGESVIMFVYLFVVYLTIADFGATAQAGFGIGSRVMQAILLPAMAIAFAVAPVAGQNFGAGLAGRVRETFSTAVVLTIGLMMLVTLVLQWRPEAFVTFFTSEPEVREVSVKFLRLIAWAFPAQGVVLVCSGLFQGLGDTRPALLSSCLRIAVFVPLTFWAAAQPGFPLDAVLYASVGTVWLQAAISYALLRGQFRRRLSALRPAAALATSG